MCPYWIIRLYCFLLDRFPARYRLEYAEELEYAIRNAVEEASAKGKCHLWRLAWRELRDLPLACLRAHLHERMGKIMDLRPGAHLPEGPIQNWKLLAVFTPFILSVLLSLGGQFMSSWLIKGVGILLLGLLFITWVVGLLKGFPAWTLPAMGQVLCAVCFVLYFLAQAVILTLIKTPGGEYWPSSITNRLILYIGFDLVFLVIAGMVVAGLLAVSRPFLQHARQDWTLVSFFFYALAIPVVWFNNDPFRGIEPFELTGGLVLAIGAGLFLVAPNRWQRLLVLFLALLLALPVVSLGIYTVFPAQEFATPDLSFRLWESLQPVLLLPALLILLCLPALLPYLPVDRNHELAEGASQ